MFQTQLVLQDGNSQDILLKPWRRALEQLKVGPALTVEEYFPETSATAVRTNPSSKNTWFPVSSQDIPGPKVTYLRPVVGRTNSPNAPEILFQEEGVEIDNGSKSYRRVRWRYRGHRRLGRRLRRSDQRFSSYLAGECDVDGGSEAITHQTSDTPISTNSDGVPADGQRNEGELYR